MVRRPASLLTFSLGVLSLAGCGDDGVDQGWSTFGQTTFTTISDDMSDEVEAGSESSGSEGDSSTSTTSDGTTSTSTTTTDSSTSTSTSTTDTGEDLCGNGIVDPGEGCDGFNFNGQSCMGLGFSGGQLVCTADCQINSSGCTNGGGGGGQPADGLYSMCLVPEDCPNNDGCAQVSMNNQVFDGYCTNLCVSDAECDAGLGGTAIPNCNNEVQTYCELVCTGGLTCPAGMECVALADRDVCY